MLFKRRSSSDSLWERPAPAGHRTPAVDLSPATVALAALALLVHALDLGMDVRMMELYGTAFEINPLALAAFGLGGPLGAAALKFTVVVGGVVLLLQLAHRGRVRLSLTCLALSALMGLAGVLAGLA